MEQDAQQRRVFLNQLRQGVYYAKVRIGWAKGRLRDAEKDLNTRKRELEKWKKQARRKNR
jgi:hypothetical protein